jgi:hypothetical protein
LGYIIGCPSYDKYDDPSLYNNATQYLYWMDGHDNYLNGMLNKVNSIENICWNNDYESLETLKHWLSDHNSGDENGGLAIIAVYTDLWTFGTFYPGTPEALKHFIAS